MINHTSEKLVRNIERLLAKYEVHNQILAIELATLVTRREKTALRDGARMVEDAYDKAFEKAGWEAK